MDRLSGVDFVQWLRQGPSPSAEEKGEHACTPTQTLDRYAEVPEATHNELDGGKTTQKKYELL